VSRRRRPELVLRFALQGQAGPGRTIKGQADGLAEAIREVAPVRTGKLRDSVKVRRRRNELDFEVTAGGDETTREAREGSGVMVDYAVFTEYGTTHEEAEPFFYPTFRAREAGIREAIEDAVSDALDRA
jgi:HK97 gp10 family phage protein